MRLKVGVRTLLELIYYTLIAPFLLIKTLFNLIVTMIIMRTLFDYLIIVFRSFRNYEGEVFETITFRT